MTSRRVLTDDLKTVEFETSEDVDVTPTFDSMGLREELLRGIYAYGKIWNKVGGEVFTWIEIGLKHCIYLILAVRAVLLVVYESIHDLVVKNVMARTNQGFHF